LGDLLVAICDDKKLRDYCAFCLVHFLLLYLVGGARSLPVRGEAAVGAVSSAQVSHARGLGTTDSNILSSVAKHSTTIKTLTNLLREMINRHEMPYRFTSLAAGLAGACTCATPQRRKNNDGRLLLNVVARLNQLLSRYGAALEYQDVSVGTANAVVERIEKILEEVRCAFLLPSSSG
jgi:hypothetical protein